MNVLEMENNQLILYNLVHVVYHRERRHHLKYLTTRILTPVHVDDHPLNHRESDHFEDHIANNLDEMENI